MNTLEGALRILRIIHTAMGASVVVYAIIGEIIAAASSQREVSMVLVTALAVLAAVLAIIAFVIHRSWVENAEDRLRLVPDEAAALGRWRSGHIITFALAEAIALYGLVLRVLGATPLYSFGFYALGIMLFLFFLPRRP